MFTWTVQRPTDLALILGILLAVSSSAQDQIAEQARFESVVGTFVSGKSTSIKIQTAEGEQEFRLAKPQQNSPKMAVGRGTSISVRGVDNVSFLRNGMTVRCTAEFDRSGKTTKPVELVDVIALSAKVETSKERISNVDPVTGFAVYRVIARIQSVAKDGQTIGGLVSNGSKKDRYEFILDPEATRVKYDLPDLTLAKTGETVEIRYWPSTSGSQLATEVRVVRPNVFGDEPDGEVEINPPIKVENPEDQPKESPDDSEESDGDDNSPDMEAEGPDEPDAPDDDGENANDVGADLDQPRRDAVIFDFPPGEPAQPGIDRKLLSQLLGIPLGEPERTERTERRLMDDWEFRQRQQRLLGQGWFKIN